MNSPNPQPGEAAEAPDLPDDARQPWQRPTLVLLPTAETATFIGAHFDITFSFS